MGMDGLNRLNALLCFIDYTVHVVNIHAASSNGDCLIRIGIGEKWQLYSRLSQLVVIIIRSVTWFKLCACKPSQKLIIAAFLSHHSKNNIICIYLIIVTDTMKTYVLVMYNATAITSSKYIQFTETWTLK